MIPLQVALRAAGSRRIALVGAGGKTRLMFRLARSYPSGTVLTTTTTHLATDQADLADLHLVVKSSEDVARLTDKLPSGIVLFTGPELPGEKRLSGLEPDALSAVQSAAALLDLPLLLEADGSRQRPLKAPADYEPVIPGFVDLVLVLSGLSAIGQPLGTTWVHRPEIFSALSGIKVGDLITKESLSQVLTSPLGGLKGIPAAARRVACLTQASSPGRRAQAADLAERLLPHYQAVVALDLNNSEQADGELAEEVAKAGEPRIHAVYERIAGIVLAAGASSRFEGGPKQLLDWEGVPLVRKVVATALQAGLDPVIVVTGANREAVNQVLASLPILLVENDAWNQGQSSSVRAGLAACPGEIGGAVFLLVDQPQIPFTLVRSLVEAHNRTRAPIVAPQIDGGRGNPVLFDRDTFRDFQALDGEKGGRALFSRYPIEWVQWHDPRMLLDIDSLEDYRRLVRDMQDPLT
jgi:molybdenum cofactor cytidylyltransferase